MGGIGCRGPEAQDCLGRSGVREEPSVAGVQRERNKMSQTESRAGPRREAGRLLLKWEILRCSEGRRAMNRQLFEQRYSNFCAKK